MKWRSLLAYLVVLLLVGGYYLYFEVFQKHQEEMAAQEARKVFHIQTDQVSSLTLMFKGRDRVRLEKGEQWHLVEPIKTEADNFSVQDLIGALAKLETEREVLATPSDLKPFGLIEPSFTIRFRAGEAEYELVVGDRNPAGDGAYAKTGDSARIFLIAEGNRSALNRGLDELRKRQLFTFQRDDVAGIVVAWRDGNATIVERGNGQQEWRAPASPERKLKTRKIENLIEQVHWLRAQGFLEDEPKNLAAHGLEPPFVTVTLQLKAGERAELKLAEKKKDEKVVAGLSSQLPAVVQVAADTLDSLPRNVQKLLDRSLLGYQPDEISEISWNLDATHGHVVRLAKDDWGLKQGDRQPEPLKEPWPVRSLLWDLSDAEYEQKIEPIPPVTPKPHATLELRNAEHKPLVTLSWEKPPQEGRAAVTVWLERDGETGAVAVDAETLKRIEGNLERVAISSRSTP